MVQHVLKHSHTRSPRGLATLDAGWVTIVIHDPTDMLPLGCGRNLNRAIAAAEALQLIGGFSDPRLMVNISDRFARFTEPTTELFHGAYGARVGLQVSLALRKLLTDPATRQAVVTFWDPWLDNLPGRLDYPCTVALRFALVADRLELDVLMRSNDAMLGFPYDVFQFGQLQQTAARVLDVPPGVYRHTAWSLHIYETDHAAANRVTPPEGLPEVRPVGLGRRTASAGDSWEDVTRRAAALRRPVGRLGGLVDPTPSERWYQDVLAPHLG